MTLYESKYRRRRRHGGPGLFVVAAFLLMLVATVLGLDMKLRGPDAFLAPNPAVTPSPTPWTPPSHPTGTGESLYLQNGTGK